MPAPIEEAIASVSAALDKEAAERAAERARCQALWDELQRPAPVPPVSRPILWYDVRTHHRIIGPGEWRQHHPQDAAAGYVWPR